MFTEICGLKTEYQIWGSGDIKVLLLHGWGSSFEVYNGIAAALSDRCTLYGVNFPGCGNTEVMKTPWNLDNYCDFVFEFIEKMQLENPIIMGHSHGGRVTMKLVAEGRVSPPKIVLLDAAGLIPKKSLKQKLKARNFKIIKSVLTMPVLKGHTENLLNRARAHYGSADYNAAPEVLRKTLVSLVNTDIRDMLPDIKCPSLLIWGDKDTATPLRDAEIIESLIPDAGLCVIKDTGHFSFCEKPYEAYAILRSFIK